MKDIFVLKPIVVEAYPGATIYNTIKEAMSLSETYGISVILKFNGKEISCRYGVNTVEELIEGYFKNERYS